MKIKLAPWKLAARGIVLAACQQWRPSFTWSCSPASRHGDYVTLSVGDGAIVVSDEVNLRLVWKGGIKRDFDYLQAATTRLLEKYSEAEA